MKKTITFLVMFNLFFSEWSVAQITKIKGKVVDEQGQALPFVNIKFLNSNVGTTTDFDGKYILQTKWAKDSLIASYLGYKTKVLKVTKNKQQTLNFKLEPNAINVKTIEIKDRKKERYRNKGNPAVALIKKVIENKWQNQKQSLDFYEYDKYEKIEFDLNNFSEEIADKKIMKPFQFVFEDYVDTSKINGKPFLPFFIKENASTVYFQKNPQTRNEYVYAEKMSGSLNRMDNDGIGHLMKKLYSDIDIYDNQIELFGNYFPSPINDFAVNIYKYYIIDTLIVDGIDCINIGFSPRSKSDFGFFGNLYIINDGSYAVKKIDMGINNQINLNFVNDLSIVQSFVKLDNNLWMLSKNNLFIDYSLGKNQMGIFGKKSVSYKNFIVNTKRNDSIYQPRNSVIKLVTNNNNQLFGNFRHTHLNEKEEGIYEMIDSIQSTRTFKVLAEASSILTSGWIDCGDYELGTVATFVSWNKVEGLKLRMGGQTTPDLHQKFQLDGHLAVGLGDLRLKYQSGIKYSFNEHFLKFPLHHIYFSLSRKTLFPGQYSHNMDLDNFLFSFNGNSSDKMLLIHKIKLDYLKEFRSNVSFQLEFENKTIKPLGNLSFTNGYNNYIKQISTDEITLFINYSPHQKFYQTKNRRRIIVNKYPIIKASHTIGFSGLFNGNYNFSKSKFELIKRFHFPLIGYSDFELELGKFWGQAPFPLLEIPRANQSLGYQFKSFNLMNYMEFINDKYLTIRLNHYFKGFIFNKLPLIKKMKIREVVGLKMLYGRLSKENNPYKNKNLLQLPVDDQGHPTSFLMDSTPYIEASVGITNIFKFLRVDLIKRFTYMSNEHPVSSVFNMPGVGIKFSAKFNF